MSVIFDISVEFIINASTLFDMFGIVFTHVSTSLYSFLIIAFFSCSSIFSGSIDDIIDSNTSKLLFKFKYSYTCALFSPVIITLVFPFGNSILCVILPITPIFGSFSLSNFGNASVVLTTNISLSWKSSDTSIIFLLSSFENSSLMSLFGSSTIPFNNMTGKFVLIIFLPPWNCFLL